MKDEVTGSTPVGHPEWMILTPFVKWYNTVMAIMTKDREHSSHTPKQDDPWKVTDELKASLEKTRRKIQERKQWFENQILSCPIDGKPSKFIRYEGAYTRVMGIFKCEDGHEFPHG